MDAYRELDYWELRIPRARKQETIRRKATQKDECIANEYLRQMEASGIDDIATSLTAENQGISVRSVYRARKRLGTKVVVLAKNQD